MMLFNITLWKVLLVELSKKLNFERVILDSINEGLENTTFQFCQYKLGLLYF
jgi:hypothetical protein